MLKRNQRVDLIARAEDMVPAGHWLVIMIAADVSAGDKVVVQSAGIRCRIVGENFEPNRIDSVCRKNVSRKFVATNTSLRTRFACCTACVPGHGVIDFVSESAKVDAACSAKQHRVHLPKLGRRNTGKRGKANDLSPALEANEDKVLFLPYWTSDDSAPLMLVVFGNGCTDEIVLKVVRIEDLIAKVLKNVPMPSTRARLYDGVHHPASETPILYVVRIGHYLKLLNGLDIGRKLPIAVVVAYGRAIQQEEILSRASAINLVRRVHVPAARTRETARPEDLLRENDARCQRH